MAESNCPHCGAKLPWVRDAFCNSCFRPLDEPAKTPLTQAEKEAFRKAGKAGAKSLILGILARIFGGL